jgi:hypothetical protein
MIDWQKRHLPEICMSIHMHHTGSCDDLTHDDHASAVAYLEARIGSWRPLANGRRWSTFDTQVLALCMATVAEAHDWMAERTALLSALHP